MASFSPKALPSINALAENFCLCARWHSEVPGPTQPNRLYMHAATSMGLVHNVWSRKFDCRTIYENLQASGKTWAVYQVGAEAKYDEVREFSNIADQRDNFRTFETDFKADMSAGTFPNYAFIVPRYVTDDEGPADSQHAPDDVRYGDNLIADVYEAIRSNDAVWANTVLIVTYDEHGGFYDHVVPPFGVPNPDGIDAPLPNDPDYVPPFAFDRLGLRVRAVIASPWVGAGTVCSKQLQHTSVLATVKKVFNLPDFLTRRDAGASAFDDLFLTKPRKSTPEKLPRARVDTFHASDARNPLHQPLDEARLQMALGASRQAGIAWLPDQATSHGEAARKVSAAVNRLYAKYRRP